SGLAALLEDLEHGAPLPTGARRRQKRADRPGRTPLATYHLAEVALGHRELHHDCVVPVDGFDFNGVRDVDQGASEVADQLFNLLHETPLRAPSGGRGLLLGAHDVAHALGDLRAHPDPVVETVLHHHGVGVGLVRIVSADLLDETPIATAGV